MSVLSADELQESSLRVERDAPVAVLPGATADPHIAAFGDRFFIYPTDDGTVGWTTTSFHTWSSRDLVHWTDEGVILDLPRDLTWARVRAWAPAIARIPSGASRAVIPLAYCDRRQVPNRNACRSPTHRKAESIKSVHSLRSLPIPAATIH